MKPILVPTHQDRLAVQKFFSLQNQNSVTWLPKIAVVEDTFFDEISPPLSFEERWKQRFLKATSFHEALFGEMDFLTKEQYFDQIKERLIQKFDDVDLSCFFENNTLDIDLPDGVVQGTLFCQSLQEEAYNIAILIRQHIEKNRIAILTSDQNLKRYIIEELKRWNIYIPYSLPLKYRFQSFLSLLKLGHTFSHSTLLDVLTFFSLENSRFLDLKILRKGPCSYEKIEKYIPFFLKPYFFLSGKVKPFLTWCEMYESMIPPFWKDLYLEKCSFEDFAKLAETLLTSGHDFVKGNTHRVTFYHPEKVSYLSEHVAIFANMNPDTVFPLERFGRCFKTPILYMTRHSHEKHPFWQEGCEINPFQKERIPLLKMISIGRPNSVPSSLSITEVEKYVRDPYAIYAKKCLNLIPLGTLDTPWRNVDFGILCHRALEDLFHQTNPSLENFFEKHFQNVDQPLRYLFWKERFKRLMPWIMEQGKPQLVEHKASITYDDFEIYGRIDRINNDGTLIDYKTGSIPTQKDILLGYNPQLLLEGIMCNQNSAEIWHLGQHDVKVVKINIDLKDVEDHVKKIIQKIRTAPFVTVPIPEKMTGMNIYEHLERIL